MKAIPLTRGAVCQVDEADFEKYGHLRWNLGAGGRYACRKDRSDGREAMVYLHRLIAGAVPGDDVHHIDGDKLNNARANLSLTVRSSHLRYHLVSGGPRSSSYKGVSYWPDGLKPRRNRWQARIKSNGISRTLGYFATDKEAAMAYDCAAFELWGSEAYLNFPDQFAIND